MNREVNVLNVFEVRKPNERLNWSPILEMNVLIPTSFKLFLETFNVLKYSNTKLYEYYSNEFDTFTNFGTYNLEFNPPVGIDSFFDVLIIKNVLHSIVNSDDEVTKNSLEGFLPIGTTPSNEYLLVGIIESNLDKIYVQANGINLFLSENIFEFCRHIYLVPESNRWLPDLSKLYRNWEENFWRIQE